GDFVPHPAVRAQDFRLLDLFEAEQPAVEGARLRFHPARDADLDVVKPFDVDLHGKEKELPRAGRFAGNPRSRWIVLQRGALRQALPAATLFDVARLRTDPQHTPPPLPLLRSRPGGVRGAGVVRSPKSDKFSRSPLMRP